MTIEIIYDGSDGTTYRGLALRDDTSIGYTSTRGNFPLDLFGITQAAVRQGFTHEEIVKELCKAYGVC